MRPALLAVLAVALLAPATAAAQFQPLPPAPVPQSEPVVPAPGSDQGGISALQQGLLILLGVGLVVGIGVAIARDARRNVPSDTRAAPVGSVAGNGGEAVGVGVGERRKPDPRAAQKQKAAAKRARQARKRNRPTRK